MQCLVARSWCPTFAGSSYVSGKLPTYPSPKPTLALTSHLGQNVGLGEGGMGTFPEMYNDPFCPWMTGKPYAGYPEFHTIRASASL